MVFVSYRKKKKWAGPLQYEDDTKELMMLPTGEIHLSAHKCFIIRKCIANLNLILFCVLLW